MENCVCEPAEIEGWRYIQWVGTHFGDCVRTLQERSSFTFGLLSLCLYLVATFPQMKKNYSRKRVDGLSFGLLIIWAGGDLSNYVGSFLTNQLPTQRMIGLYFLCTDIIMIWQWIYYTHYYTRLGFTVPEQSLEREPLLQEEEVFITPPSSLEAIVPSQPYTEPPRRLSKMYLLILGAQVIMSFVLLFSLEFLLNQLLLGHHSHHSKRQVCDQVEELPHWLTISGSVMAWISGSLYFTSRIPQILENHRSRSVEGLSLSLFVITIMANCLYGLSIFLRFPTLDAKFFQSTLPYIIGSAGTIVFDIMIMIQAFVFQSK